MIKKYNKALLFCAMATIASATAIGQEQKHELRAFYQDGLTMTLGSFMFDGFFDGLSAGLGGYNLESRDYTLIGGFGAGYRYQISKRFKVGADIGYQPIESQVVFKKAGNPDISLTRKKKHLFLMPKGEFVYFSKSLFSLYGSASLGIIYYNWEQIGSNGTQSGDMTSVAFQVNPIGLRVGKAFGGFMEFGAGFQGFLQMGLNYRF